MDLNSFYRNLVKFGIEADPRRDKSGIRSYYDTAILYGNPSVAVKRVLVGIDMELPEILLAERLRINNGLDLILSHHPQGPASAGIYEVLGMQEALLVQAGVPAKTAGSFVRERKREVERKILPANHMRAVDAARLLDMPFVCCHTVADNHAFTYLRNLLERNNPRKVGDIVSLLLQEPEYSDASGRFAGPKIILGCAQRSAGKIFYEITGGTEGHQGIYKELYKCGYRTIVAMHLSEEHFRKAADSGVSVVIAGHISSDTLGMNLVLDKVEKLEKLEIISCSGFRRFKRR